MLGREGMAAATFLYAVALVAWIGADPWMWWVWSGGAVALAGAVVLILLLGGAEGGGLGSAHRLRAMAPPVAAAAAFALIAVLAATLETRGFARIEVVYWALGGGMLLVVATFLMSYDRGRRVLDDESG